MKKNILFAALMMAATLTQARITLAPEAGICFSSMKVNLIDVFGTGNYEMSCRTKPKLRAGVAINLPFAQFFFVQSGLFWAPKEGNYYGYESGGIYTEASLKMNYMDIPVNLGYQYGMGRAGSLILWAGVYFSVATSGSIVSDSYDGGKKVKSLDIDELYSYTEFSRIDDGMAFGLEYKSPWGVYVKGQYSRGLADLYDGSEATLRNRSWSIMLGYAFSF